MKRSMALVLGLALAISACGGGSAVTTTAATTAAAARTPINDPGLPEVPLLPTPSGTPEVIDRICVQVSSGPHVMNTESASEVMGRALGLLGIDVVDDDCRAVLNITATGSRSSANYSGLGQCWSGWTYRIETELTVDDEPQRAWVERDQQSPPASVTGCTSRDTRITPRTHPFLTPVFRDMWGNPGLFAIEAARSKEVCAGGCGIPDDLEFTDDVLQLIATYLLNEPIGDYFGEDSPIWWTLYLWTGRTDPRIASLLPLTPYLITLLERQASGEDPTDVGTSTYGYMMDLLGAVTGQDLSGAEYWEWWDGQ